MRLLIVGTLGGQVTVAAKIALSKGAKVVQVDDIATAMNTLRSGQSADLVMIDVALDIATLVLGLKTERIHLPVVACGIGSDASAAVRAIKAGAKEYLPLPPNAELIAAVLAAVTEESSSILFRNPAMRETLRLADQVAASEASVLICGESGTGKELFARYLHRRSRRADRPMVSVNCAAIPENLLESELFGHEKGAFTGAVARRIGKFEEANGGTLLLDEVSEMDVRLQAKLLRAIQEREIDRVGGTHPIKVDIRVLATTNRDLEAEVRAGRFREDLFYRLNVIALTAPPLRTRREDIPLLVDHFLTVYCKKNGRARLEVSREALAKMAGYSWPGNVRELENVVERAVVLCRSDTLRLEDLPDTIAVSESSSDSTITFGVGTPLDEVERRLIRETLRHAKGDKSVAAQLLGISTRTIYRKLGEGDPP